MLRTFGFDSGVVLVLVCAYTGKEVVGCEVQIVIVVALPDQVRWLRLRAVALSGASGADEEKLARQKLQPAHYR